MKSQAPKDEGRILSFLREFGPATTDEIEFGLGLKHQTASARVNGLTEKGFIEPHGDTKRPTRSGRLATVHRLVDAIDGR